MGIRRLGWEGGPPPSVNSHMIEYGGGIDLAAAARSPLSPPLPTLSLPLSIRLDGIYAHLGWPRAFRDMLRTSSASSS